MTVKLALQDIFEVYILDKRKIKNPSITWQANCNKKCNLFLFYSRKVGQKYGPESIRESVEFSSSDGRQFLDNHLQDMYSQLPFFNYEKNLAILLLTYKNGNAQRFMQTYPAFTKSGNYERVPYDLSRWDSDIVEKCALLPEHVRKVIGI